MSVVKLLSELHRTVQQSKLDLFIERHLLWNKEYNYCVHASSVDMFKNRIDKYLVKAGYT